MADRQIIFVHNDGTGKVYKVTNKATADNNWSQAVNSHTERPNPWVITTENWGSCIIVPDSGYKITKVEFELGEIYEGEFMALDSDFINLEYPEMEDMLEGTFAKIDAVVSDGTKGAAFRIAKNANCYRVTTTYEADAPTPPPTPTTYKFFQEPPTHFHWGWYNDYNFETGSFTETVDELNEKYPLTKGGSPLPAIPTGTPALLLDEGYQPADVEEFNNSFIYANGGDYCMTGNSTFGGYIEFIYKPSTATADLVWDFSRISEIIGDTDYQLTLVRTGCAADRDDVSRLKPTDTISIIFTPSDGYEFKATTDVSATATAEVVSVLNENGTITTTITTPTADTTLTATAHSKSPTPTDEDVFPFVNVYNPTLTQLKEALSKVWVGQVNIPSYIVKLQKIFCKPNLAPNAREIKFGGYKTGVSAPVCSDDKVIVDFGSVTLPELHHNALDYSPYTTVKIFLPFMGFFDLDVDKLTTKPVSLRYIIDIISGRCLAELSIPECVLYRFAGTSYKQEPYYIAENEQKTTAYINEAYALTDRIPYFVISRPIDTTPDVSRLNPQVTATVAVIGDCSGYIRCKEVWVEGLTATEAEKTEIEALLKTGILVN